MTPLSLIQTVRKLQIRTSHLAQGLLSGAYRSAFRGRGLEFEDVRPYEEGDDVRSIDWSATAKMNTPYVKTFREERKLSVMLMVDISRSCAFGGKGATKRELIAEIGACLAFSAIKNNDKVGLLLFSDRVEKYLPPKQGLRHVLRIVFEILTQETKQKATDLQAALDAFGKTAVKGSVCFVLSDFLSPAAEVPLKILSKRHDMIGILVKDPLEECLPHLGLARLRDLESGRTVWIDTENKEIQQQYQKTIRSFREQAKASFLHAGGGFLEVSTDAPYIDSLHRFFQLRGKRR